MNSIINMRIIDIKTPRECRLCLIGLGVKDPTLDFHWLGLNGPKPKKDPYWGGARFSSYSNHEGTVLVGDTVHGQNYPSGIKVDETTIKFQQKAFRGVFYRLSKDQKGLVPVPFFDPGGL